MPSIVVHCFDPTVRDQLQFQLHNHAEIRIDSGNPHALFVSYDAVNTTLIQKSLDDFAKSHRIDVIKQGHALDGKLRAHMRLAPNTKPTPHDLGARAIGQVVANSGNLPTLFGAHYAYPAQQGSPVNIAVISLGGTFLTSDLQTFWTSYLGRAGNYPTITYQNTDAGSTSAPNQPITNANSGASQENTLDLEILLSLCPTASIKVYFGSNTVAGFYTAFSTAISEGVCTGHPNTIISCSWGGPELGFGSQANTYSSLFQTAVAAGKTICAASGDSGSGDGNLTLQVDFPASSPYVVCCGGTSLNLTSGAETVWAWNPTYQWGTGGGVSAIFVRPAYQQGVITSPSDIVNHPVYRSVPDIALNADPLQGWSILFNGQLYRSGFGGTSCAAPAFAAFLGLCNKSYTSHPFGVLNTLWSHANGAGFKDIVSGSNASVPSKPTFYTAHTGPDQCTGLGSIHGTTLLPLL